MRFMMLMKASEELDLRKYNEQLARAGVLLDFSRLQPGGSIAAYWLIQAKSKEEAVEWAKRVPSHDGEIEVVAVRTE